MSKNTNNDVATRLQDLLRLRKRIGMADAMVFSTMVAMAAECGVDNLLAVTPQDLIASLGAWLPQDDQLLFVPNVPPERDEELRQTMRLLKQRCCEGTG